ncbi:MAG TPA: hypothetical protein VGF99_07380 [Myxococcota bacterium]
MNASMLALLLAASSSAPQTPTAADPASPGDVVATTPTSTAPVVASMPTVATSSWSIGGGVGVGGPVAAVERRLVGPVWLGLSLGAGLDDGEGSQTLTQAGDAPIEIAEERSGWNASADVRFRLQLVPDDSFVRPSLFLGAGVAANAGTANGLETRPGETDVTTVSDSFSLSSNGNFGAVVDVALLPWLALRASSSLVSVGYTSTVSTVRIEQEGAATIANDSTSGGLYARLDLRPAISVHAFF